MSELIVTNVSGLRPCLDMGCVSQQRLIDGLRRFEAVVSLLDGVVCLEACVISQGYKTVSPRIQAAVSSVSSCL